MNNQYYVKTLRWTALVLLLVAAPLFSQLEIMQYTVASGGDTRGIAVKGYHVYLANGNSGLKIINLTNPRYPLTTGALPLNGRFCDQVAVSGNMVGLTDTDNDFVCFVDAKDKMRPILKAALKAGGDIPRGLVMSNGKAFVVERGAHMAAPVYFSGVEVFDFAGTTVRSRQLTAIADVRDVAATSQYLLVATSHDLQVFSRTVGGFAAMPVTTVDFPVGEEIASITLHGQYLFAFGRNQLYVIGHIPLALVPVPGSLSPGLPAKSPLSPALAKEIAKKPSLKLKILVQAAVAGDTENRRIDAATIVFGGGSTSRPKIYLLLTTRTSYGLYIFDPTAETLTPFDIFDWRAHEHLVLYDIHEASGGEISIYDAAFPEYFAPGWNCGGVMGIGALGPTGFGYAIIDTH